jgi:hypothetical protein
MRCYTLQIGHPYIQVSSQDSERGIHPCAATCPAVPGPASEPRWAPELARVQWLQTPPLDKKGSDVSTCIVAPDLWGGLRCITCLVAPDPSSLPGGLWCCYASWVTDLKHKKSLAGLPIQLDSHVPNARVHVSEALDIRAIMGLQDV